jgi:replicative DNA helicase
MSEDRFSSSLSESLLTLICFVTSDKTKLVVSSLQPDYFDGNVYRDIASRTLEFWKQFNEAPNTSHIDDIFDHVLGDPNNKLRSTYQRLLSGMYEQSKSLNVDYVASRVFKFIRQQTLKKGVLQAAQRYQQGGDELEDDVERILLDTVKIKVDVEDPGTFLSDKVRALSFLDRNENEYCNLGIPELDYREICPTRQELYLFVAPRGRGKSLFCVHCCKKALQQRWKVLYISLELSEKMITQRLFQSFFGITKRDEPFLRTSFEFDELKRLSGFTTEKVIPKLNLQEPNIRKYLISKMDQWGIRLNNILIKRFPSGTLTISKMKSYLDSVEITHKFIPDMLIVDYPRLMKQDARNLTQSLGQTVVDLRGLGVERNCAVIAPAQGTRESEKVSKLQNVHIAEDISMIATSDNVVTYSQTEDEKQLGLARLYASKVRNDMDRLTILITQNYHYSQFVLQSAMMNGDYWDVLKEKLGTLKDEEED